MNWLSSVVNTAAPVIAAPWRRSFCSAGVSTSPASFFLAASWIAAPVGPDTSFHASCSAAVRGSFLRSFSASSLAATFAAPLAVIPASTPPAPPRPAPTGPPAAPIPAPIPAPIKPVTTVSSAPTLNSAMRPAAKSSASSPFLIWEKPLAYGARRS